MLEGRNQKGLRRRGCHEYMVFRAGLGGPASRLDVTSAGPTYRSDHEIRYSGESPMTLLDAPQYDRAKEKRRKIKITLALLGVLILAALAWMYRNWPEEHVVDKFFTALQKQDYEAAYGIYFHDPSWRQHPQKYPQYTYADFYRDWGPGGEWGLIKSHHIYGSAGTRSFGSGTFGNAGGTVVEVIVNERAEHARMFVQKSDKTLTVYPY
jgi:hypothetical protein